MIQGVPEFTWGPGVINMCVIFEYYILLYPRFIHRFFFGGPPKTDPLGEDPGS